MRISRKYEVQGQLGRGSMGVVYKVRHLSLDTISALKALPPYLMENPELVKRFYREARVLAGLKHPNIVRIIDIDRDDSQHFLYLVMEYIQGQTLSQYLQKKGPLPLPEVLEITRQVAHALKYAHSYNPPVIHRDIKPANIMVEDDSRRVVVMDFGIAKELGGETDLTRTGMMLGTLKYCPPEQLSHEPLDSSADVYALGMVMYEVYTGTHLLAGLDGREVIGRLLDTREHAPRFTRPTPLEFVAIVSKAIAKNPDKRYRRMTDLLTDIETYWPTLTGTEPLFVQAPTKAEPQPGAGYDDLTEIDQQIHKLEEERERRLVVSLQTKAREAREKAAGEGAVQLASSLFERGCTREERGHEHLHQQQYLLAREAYEEAASLFAQADKEAITAALIQRASQARQEMMAAKAEADHYGARERARTFYRQGLALEAKADELWEHKEYQQTWQVYSEAHKIFEDAHEVSYHQFLKEEAIAAQEQMGIAREQAIKEGAEEFARQVFQEAVRSEQQASKAVSAEEFTQAQELYGAASRQYELAQQQARTERQRRDALIAQQRAEKAQHEAEAAGATPEQGVYRQATEAQGQGDVWLGEQEYEQAARAYEQAREGYARARQEAEQARKRQAVVQARQRVEEARAAAERAGARERLGAEFIQAQRLAEQGRKCEEREQLVKALSLHEEAMQEFSRLFQQAKLQVAQEEAEAARQRLMEVKKRGAALRAWAEAAWVKADQEAGQAEAAWQEQAYSRAVELYARALQAYERAQEQAQEEQRHQQALEAYRQAEEAQKAAEQAEYAQEPYQKAMDAKNQGERALAAKRWPEATKALGEARQLFARVVLLEAEQARQEMMAAKAKAEQQDARDKAHTFYRRALALEAQAEELWERETYLQARQMYVEARSLFEEVWAFAHRKILKQEAETDRTRARAAREAAVSEGAEEFARQVFQEAVHSEQQASKAVSTEEFTQARELYGAACRQYELAQQQARTERQRRNALTAQQRAEKAQHEAEAAGATPEQGVYRQATEAQGQGDVWLGEQEYEQAARAYEQAREGYARARQEAEQARKRQAVVQARQRVEKARAAADQAGARERSGAEFIQVKRLAEQGRECEQREDFAESLRCYEQAAQAFLQLSRETLLQVACEEAETTRQRMVKARERSKMFMKWAEEPWAEAQEWEAQAEQAYQAQEYERAIEDYERACQAYEHVQVEAHEVQSYQLALAAQQQAKQSQKAAEEAGAQHYAQALYQRAVEAKQQGEQSLNAHRWEEATKKFGQASALFSESLQGAKHTKVKQAAQAAKESALAAQQEAQQGKGAELSPEQFAEAMALRHQAEQRFDQEDFGTAQALFDRSAALFRLIYQDTVVYLQREQAEQSRAHAQEL